VRYNFVTMKTTLQNRLILLMIISSVVFVVAFSTIQLWGHKQNADRFMTFKTRNSVKIITDSFNIIFKEQNYTPEILKNTLYSLKNLNLIEDAAIFNREGNIITQTDFLYRSLPPQTFIERALILNRPYTFMRTKKYVYGFIQIPNNLMVGTVFSTITIQKALSEVLFPIVGIIIFVVIANFILATLLSKALVNPVSVLYNATTDIAKGDLDKRVDIHTEDELQELAEHFNFMTKELKKMKARAENANPLTKLPGNVMIQEDVERRIKEGEKFVVIYCDLDNFKAFNDKYGVHKGDDAIKLTAEIFKESVNKVGAKGDFVGHEGGDDFLLVTVPGRSENIANYIITEFDKRVRSLYSKEDLDKGYIEAKARHGDQIMKFPIMTISLAGITNVHRTIASYAEITNVAAEVKKKAKGLAGSNFVMDKRVD